VTERIGFFGTGLMGAPMAGNLLRRGYPLTVWNRTPARYAELVAAGAIAGETPRAVAAQSDVLISMLVEPAHLEAILAGPDGILAGITPGSLFLDMSTGPPRVARALAARFAERSVAFLDAPVRGGVGGAADGTLMVMAGGEEAAFARALPVLQSIGNKVIHVGPAGSGRIAKTAHQLVGIVNVEAVAEALALARAFGADERAVREVLVSGSSASPVVAKNSARIVARDWNPGLPLWVYAKDAASVDDVRDATGLTLPLAQEAFARVRALIAEGRGELDESALATLLEPPPT
jgi:3-hydroxyisobutyrate dehydrogenase-like beta-hydroxyacid dehydrogenase